MRRVPEQKHCRLRFQGGHRDGRIHRPRSTVKAGRRLTASRPEENIVSNMQARVTAHDRAFHVEGYERIEYDLEYVDGIFDPLQSVLADCYRPYGRALVV